MTSTLTPSTVITSTPSTLIRFRGEGRYARCTGKYKVSADSTIIHILRDCLHVSDMDIIASIPTPVPLDRIIGNRDGDVRSVHIAGVGDIDVE